MRGEWSDETAWSGWVCKFRIEAARCFRQVAAILDWAENRHDQSISESDIRRIAVHTASMEPPRNRDGRSKNHLSRVCMNQVMGIRMPTPLPRPKEARRAKKGRTRGPHPSSLVIASGVARVVIRKEGCWKAKNSLVADNSKSERQRREQQGQRKNFVL